jgi:hypothetical protein
MKTNAFNWDINQTGILDINGNPIKGYKQITRDDNGSSIAVMKDSFNPMTTQQFSDTANEVAEKIGGTIKSFNDWDTTDKSRNLGQARPVITCQIEISEPLEIAGSKVEGLLTLGVGFDGSRSFFIGHTNTYLRCSNQFGSIVEDFTSRLTKNNLVRVEDIIQRIGLYREFEKTLYENFQKLQGVKVSEEMIQECVARLVKMNEEERAFTAAEREEHFSTQRLNKIDSILSSVRGEMSEVGQNAWGLFNGVTHYTTHVMKAGGTGDYSMMFGAKKEANMIALNYGLELLNS